MEKGFGLRVRSLSVVVLAVEEEGKLKPKSCLESGRGEERLVRVLELGFGRVKEELWKLQVAISMALSHSSLCARSQLLRLRERDKEEIWQMRLLLELPKQRNTLVGGPVYSTSSLRGPKLGASPVL